jgi:hypothetical protein
MVGEVDASKARICLLEKPWRYVTDTGGGDEWRPQKIPPLILALALQSAFAPNLGEVIDTYVIGLAEAEAVFGEDSVKRARGVKEGSGLPRGFVEYDKGLRLAVPSDVADTIARTADALIAGLNEDTPVEDEALGRLRQLIAGELTKLEDADEDEPNTVRDILLDWSRLLGGKLPKGAEPAARSREYQIPRPRSIAAVAAWLDRTARGVFVVHGPPQTGKSILLGLLGGHPSAGELVIHDAARSPLATSLCETLERHLESHAIVVRRGRALDLLIGDLGRAHGRFTIAIDGLSERQRGEGSLLEWVEQQAGRTQRDLRLVVTWPTPQPPRWALRGATLDLTGPEAAGELVPFAEALLALEDDADISALAREYAELAGGSFERLKDLANRGPNASRNHVAAVVERAADDPVLYDLAVVLAATTTSEHSLHESELIRVIDAGRVPLDAIAKLEIGDCVRDRDGRWRISAALAHHYKADERALGRGHQLLAEAFLARDRRDRRDRAYLAEQGPEHVLEAWDALEDEHDVVLALSDPAWLELRWPRSPDRLAFDVSRMADRLGSVLRTAPMGGERPPCSPVQLARLLLTAAGGDGPDGPGGLWPMLHDAALNASADDDVVAWLKARALSDGEVVASILHQPDSAHPPALVWSQRERTSGARVRDLVVCGPASEHVVVLDSTGAVTVHDVRKRERRTLPLTDVTALAVSDAELLVGTRPGDVELWAVEREVMRIDSSRVGDDRAGTVLDLIDVPGRTTAALLSVGAGRVRIDEVTWTAPPTRTGRAIEADLCGLVAFGDRVVGWGPEALTLGSRHYGKKLLGDRKVTAVAAHPASQHLVVAFARGGAPLVLRVVDGAFERAGHLGATTGARIVRCLRPLRDGRFVTGENDGMVRICGPDDPDGEERIEDAVAAEVVGIVGVDPGVIALADHSGELAVVQVGPRGHTVIARERLPVAAVAGLRRAGKPGARRVLTIGEQGVDLRLWDLRRLRRSGAAAIGDVRAMCASGTGDGFVLVTDTRVIEATPDGAHVVVDDGGWRGALADVVATGPETVLVRTTDQELVEVDLGIPQALDRSGLGLAVALAASPARAYTALRAPGGEHVLRAWDGDGEIRLPASPSLVAVTASGRIACVSKTHMSIWEDDEPVFEADLDVTATALCWLGDRLIVGGPGGRLATAEPGPDEWELHPPVPLRRRAGRVRQLLALGERLFIVGDERGVVLARWDHRAEVVGELATRPELAAAAPLASSGRRGQWIVALASRAEHVTWREIFDSEE